MQVIFEFSGGPLDGKTVVGEAGGQNEAGRYYALTHHGTVGQHFSVASEYAIDTLTREGLHTEAAHHFQRHTYVVTDRLEGQDELFLRAQYLPKTKPPE